MNERLKDLLNRSREKLEIEDEPKHEREVESEREIETDRDLDRGKDHSL